MCPDTLEALGSIEMDEDERSRVDKTVTALLT
jgi:hypothetical protein